MNQNCNNTNKCTGSHHACCGVRDLEAPESHSLLQHRVPMAQPVIGCRLTCDDVLAKVGHGHIYITLEPCRSYMGAK